LVGAGIYSFVLARFGLRGLLDLKRPWLLLLLLAAAALGLASGFRSFVVLAAMIFSVLFCIEGLHRTRYLAAFLGVALLGGAIVLPQADKMPLVVQRALSFLPGKFDYMAQHDADSSTGWRLEMWKQALPEVPRTLFRGKGWGIDAAEYYTGVQIGEAANPFGSTVMVGNYHNGPLSVLIPFGLYGAITFLWFVIEGLRVLHRNWKFGSPSLRNVNALLLAAFTAHTLFFLGVFGSLHSDMAIFAGLLGLSVALNGADGYLAPAEQSVTDVSFNTEYVKA
jgi:O-antigen ligase